MNRPDDPAQPGGADAQPNLARMRALLDDSLQDVDAATLSRLNRARQQALQGISTRRFDWRAPALALACACALMLLLVPGQRTPEAPHAAPAAAFSDLEIELLSDADGLELLEDLEFYAWLEAEQAWDGSSS